MRRFIVLALGLLIFITGCSQAARDAVKPEAPKIQPGILKVHFIDVGQADAILVQAGEENMLIDAGNNEDGEGVENYLKQQGVKKLSVVMGTHPHEDHVGGMDHVINAFTVDKVYLPKVNHSTQTYKDVLLAVKEKNLKATAAQGGQTFTLGEARVDILAPNGTGYEELNDYSIVCKVTFGDSSFLLTGDAEGTSEQEMLKKGYNLKAEVLKIGHHGSSSSTGEQFLKAVSPKMAVISVGQNNDYGHPHRETLQKLAAAQIKVYRTSQAGTIVMTSDGKKIEVETARATSAAGSTGQNKEYVDSRGRGLIKGNINKKGDKIYHLPEQANYERTKPEVWFTTEAEAEAAGFRKADR
ncbi:beta-lactamase [Desulforamulus profundi]|uniref:Beta-lactamase n=1 Tax=Desulforamulus profundi TaxID=1383067 RepID=A0A2C6MD31_9FIRM|nr:ComEC/Rec2 family competence protein [Desulforamulus profundi]PHJ37166.1 beta-lactamase [Desulforamulus profundi]PHJ37748.1 beta-lactamase [Desulforamulus profundi]